MINFDKFYESNYPNLDFIIDNKNRSELETFLKRLHFKLIKINGINLYINKLSSPIERRSIIFSGISYTNNSLLVGPLQLTNPIFEDTGEFYSIEICQKNLIVRNDLFGLSPIYVGNGLVSNRLQLIYLALKECKQLNINLSYLDTPFLIWNAFSQQISTNETIIKGVRKLLQNEFINILENRIDIEKDPDKDVPFSLSTFEAYSNYIYKAAHEIVSKLERILSFAGNPFLALTGGKDSRVLYAALVSMGRINDVQIITNKVGRDQEIATGLVKKFGGRFSFPDYHSINYSNFLENLERYFSHYFFNKINLPDIYLKENIGLSRDLITLVGGYCGEVYYDFYQGIGLSLPNNKFDINDFLEFINRNQAFLSSERLNLASDLRKTFENLNGETWSQKLASHYLNFRNCFHFGSRINLAHQLDLSPLVSRYLFKASRCLPDNIRDSSRIVFDITNAFNEEIAHSQYEKYTYDYSKLAYHKRSKYDGLILPLTPDLNLIKENNSVLPNIATKNLQQQKMEFLKELLEINKKEGFDLRFYQEAHKQKIEYFIKKKSQNIDKYITAILMSLFVRQNIN